MCADKKKATLEGMAKTEQMNDCSLDIVVDPIDNAKAVSQLTDEGNGVKSFTKPNGDKFLFGDLGISFVPSGRDVKEAVAVCNYLSVDGRYRDKDGNNWGRIVSWYDDDGNEHTLRISEADLSTKASEVLEALSSGGLHALCGTSRGMPNRVVDFIRSYPPDNLPKCRSTKAFGWFKPGQTFVLPDLILGDRADNEAVIFDGADVAKVHYSQKGTLEDWQKSLGYLAQYSSRIGFFTCVAFASPLASLVGEQSGGFHLYGLSSTGKSSALRVMCSVFAPAISGDRPDSEMGSWRATDNNLENVCSSHKHLPLICDELKQGNPKLLEDVIYMIGNEVGKGRSYKGLKAKDRASWRLLYASAGELTADEMASRAGLKLDNGARVRLVNIPLPNKGLGVFESLAPNMQAKDMADMIREYAESKYYGTAGIAYLQAFIDEMKAKGLDAVVSKIKDDVRAFVNEVTTVDDDPMVGRVAKRFGLVAVAGSLAEKYEVLPWSEGTAKRFAIECFNAWRGTFKTKRDIDRDLVEWVLSVPETLRERFDIITVEEHQLPYKEESRSMDILGSIVIKTLHKRAYFIPKAFDTLVNREGVAKRECLDALRDSGVLCGRDRGYFYKVPNGGVDGLQPNARFICVQFSPNPFDEDKS